MRLALVLLLVSLCAGPEPARAELYQCRGPDGKTLFTSDRSKCPGAESHRPSGSLQRSQPSAPARTLAAPARPAAAYASDEEAEAQAWRAKRSEAQTALQKAEAQLELLHEVAGWCNRGHEVFAEDRDGLRHGVDCSEVDREERAVRREKKRLEGYLEEGLEEECRRAGCLPGWLR